MIGTVLRIERASIHDGPGIRTVVFLKGCPLRCKWCSTPESQSFTPQKGLNRRKCVGCGLCVAACPRGALSIVDGRAAVDNKKCNEGMQCVDICPSGAFVRYGSEMSVEDVLREIQKDEIFFYHSGGGVTLSGGEPLAQPEFAAAILKGARERGVNTAIETTLFAPRESVALVLPWLNHLYVDMKQTDPAAHVKWVGADNALILENLRAVAGLGFKGDVTVRIPLIPSVNDDDDNLARTAALCGEVRALRQVELLPYHRIGMGTYENLGLDYELAEIKTPSREHLNERIAFMEGVAPGIKVVIAK